jgi:hypothetical protein
LNKRFLGEVIGEHGIATRKVAEKPSHGGLMANHQCAECRAIVGGEHARNQLGVR